MSLKIPDKGALRISASAGSGKTFTLTQLYIQRALKSPDAFKGILAITFTNKAANELQEKIIKKLRALTTAQTIASEDEVLGFTSPQHLRERASAVLKQILHQYDDFQVSTIDSFFQSLFSKLSFEAGLPFGLKTELDENMVKNEVLEEGLLNLPENLKKILLENLLEVLAEKGKDWKSSKYLRSHLIDFLFKTRVVQFQYKENEETFRDEAVLQAKKVLEQYKEEKEAEITQKAAAVWEFVRGCGYENWNPDPEKDKSFVKEISNIQKVATGKDIFIKPLKNHQQGKFNYKCKARPFSPDEEQILVPLLIAYSATQGGTFKANYLLAKAILDRLSATRLLVYFRKTLRDLNQKHERYLLSETKFVLDHLIQDSDVPFIFEKLGQQLHTLLIDEFQDTDQIQWKVLRPLAAAIVDKGGFFSVVGDVKQSIYGWRGAESWLFHKGLTDSLKPITIAEHNLEENYRSEDHIIRFNNFFFTEVSSGFPAWILDSKYVKSAAGWDITIKENYRNVKQNRPESKEADKGFVEFRCRNKPSATTPEREEEEGEGEGDEEGENQSFAWLTEDIKRLQDQGIPASDIAILLRGNKEIDDVVSVLDKQRKRAEPGYDFSYTAFYENKAGSQPAMDFLANAMQALQNPEPLALNTLRFQLKHLDADSSWWESEPGQNPDWFENFKDLNIRHLDERQQLAHLLDFFNLGRLQSHQNAIVQFQNLVYEFQKNHRLKYPDFQTWWTQSGSEKKTAGDDKPGGIQIMTIHKSKGLDFGVVIYPVTFNQKQVSQWASEIFWLDADTSPWNAYPLLFANGKRDFLDTDPGDDYQNLVYNKALEYLNLFYVAMTRPRYGLILDFTFKTNPAATEEKTSGTKLGNLAWQGSRLLHRKRDDLAAAFGNFEWYPEDPARNLHFGFIIGKVAPEAKKKEEATIVLNSSPAWTSSESTPWSLSEPMNEEAKEGICLHAFLEKLERLENWEEKWHVFQKENHLPASSSQKLTKQLENLFQREEIKTWFSDRYISLSELEMLSENGKILRADRLLKSDKELVVLDFKTGEKEEMYSAQVKEYMKIASSVFSLPAKGFLVYTQDAELKEI